LTTGSHRASAQVSMPHCWWRRWG